MALENLEPATRIESILDGEDIEPATRLEYFLKQAAAGGNGANGLIVTVTYDESNRTWSLDKSYAEIAPYINNGVPAFFLEESNGRYIHYHVVRNAYFGGSYIISLFGVENDGTVTVYDFISSTEDGVLETVSEVEP